MPDLRLHFSNRQQADHPLSSGVHRLVRQASGHLGLGDAVQGALLAQFCVDRRGLWLQVANGARGIHVNGRPVKRMSLLRAGDAVYADGVELAVRGRQRLPPGELSLPEDAGSGPGVVLRGVGGSHHGRSFTLGSPRLVGAAREADIRIDDPSFPQRQALLQGHGEHVLLRDLGSPEGCRVNGFPVRDALLSAGDQLVFDGQHRFVVEVPSVPEPVGRAVSVAEAAEPAAVATDAPAPASRGVRLPWLLLAALLLGAMLSALLWFGAR